MTLGKVERPPEENKPSEAELLAAEQTRVRELEAKLQAQEAADQARREAYEAAIGQRFAQAQQVAPRQAESAEVYQAQQELGITDEDLAENPLENIKKIAEYQARVESQKVRDGIAPVMKNLVTQSYQLQLRELSSDPFYEDVGPLVQQYFTANPDQMLVDGRVQSVYYEIVGKNLPELQQRQAARAPVEPPPTRSSKAPEIPSINTPPPGRDVAPLKPAAVGSGLTEEKEYLMNIYNKLGADLDPDEWAGIEKGQILPKNRAADWQHRGRPEDARVTNYESDDFGA